MVTPNMTQDRPRTRTKLQQPPFSPFPPLEISSGSGLVLQNLFGAMCKSLDVTISVPGSLSGLHFTPWRCWSAADDCNRSVEVMYYYYYYYIYIYIYCLQRLKTGDLRRLDGDEPSPSVKPSARS